LSAPRGQLGTASHEQPFRFNDYNACPPRLQRRNDWWHGRPGCAPEYHRRDACATTLVDWNGDPPEGLLKGSSGIGSGSTGFYWGGLPVPESPGMDIPGVGGPPKAPLLPGRPGLSEILGPIMHRSLQGLQEFMRQNCNIVNLNVWNVPMAASMGYVMIKVGGLFFDPGDFIPRVMQEDDEDTNKGFIDRLLEGIGWGETSRRVGKAIDDWAQWIEDFACIAVSSQKPTWWQWIIYAFAGLLGALFYRGAIAGIMEYVGATFTAAFGAYIGIIGLVFLALWLIFGGARSIREWWGRRPWRK